ncbi:MAG: hypothetical protein DHS20C10_10480 [marine bacterium B5-7]|nr:MAG: hypothetical protein DHS20C10_10480 [marine bacterium B5-7]
MMDVENVTSADGTIVALLISGAQYPSETTFLTPADLNQQVGYIVRKKGEVIEPHHHLDIQRNIVGTSEVLVVCQGKLSVDFYTENNHCFATRQLTEGNVLVLCSGGHGFRVEEDTVLLEIKQGPFTEGQDKRKFTT